MQGNQRVRGEPQTLPILYVDDEEQNLRTFELTFRREFEVLLARSAAEGMDVLAHRRVAVVLSDQRMPEMSGTEFLARVREYAPETIRVLVTAYGDASTLAEAINNGEIYRFVAKPWDVSEMRLVLNQSVDVFALRAQSAGAKADFALLHALGRELAGIGDRREIADIVRRRLVQEWGFDSANLLLANDGNAGEASDDQEGFRLVIDEDSEISPERTPGLWKDLEAGNVVMLQEEAWDLMDPDCRTLIRRISAEDLLVIPLRGNGGLAGVMTVDNRRGGCRIGSSEKMLLECVGWQVAGALRLLPST